MDERIDRLQRLSAGSRGVLCLAGGLPAEELFPRRALADAFVSVLGRSPSSALQYGWPEGSEPLRRWIAARLVARGASLTAEDVIVTSGAQQALAIATEIVGVRGAAVAVDPETYPVALDLFRARGAATVLEPERAAFVYVVAGASNPRARGLDEARRAALLASGRPLVADEAYAELRFDGRAPRPLLASARDRVFHLGTVSKTLCPGLRVGWLVPPPSARDDAVRLKREMDLQAASLGQAVLARYLEREDEDARVARARRLYAERVERLIAAVRRELPSARFDEPEGGFAVFVETDLGAIDEARALATANALGVSFDPASMFRASASPSPLGMRLSCSNVSGEEIDEAVRRLARALRALSR